MSPTEVDRLSKQLTDVRIQIAGEFATIKAEIRAIKSDHGRFSWSDVTKFLTAIGALVAAAYTVTHW